MPSRARSRLFRIALASVAALVLAVGSFQTAPPVFASSGVVAAQAPQTLALPAGTISLATANALFTNTVNASKTTPSYSNYNFIEWRYPDDGCWARAEVMLTIMRKLNSSVTLGREWALGYKDEYRREKGVWPGVQQPGVTQIYAITTYGEMFWDYHVAATAQVVQSNGSVATMVFDPTWFSAPVSVATWDARLYSVAHVGLGITGTLAVYWTGMGVANPATRTGTGFWVGDDPTAPAQFIALANSWLVYYHSLAVGEGRY